MSSDLSASLQRAELSERGSLQTLHLNPPPLQASPTKNLRPESAAIRRFASPPKPCGSQSRVFFALRNMPPLRKFQPKPEQMPTPRRFPVTAYRSFALRVKHSLPT